MKLDKKLKNYDESPPSIEGHDAYLNDNQIFLKVVGLYPVKTAYTQSMINKIFRYT